MATKAKESNVVVKEKKTPSSTTSTKKTTKPSTTTNTKDKATTSNPRDKATTTNPRDKTTTSNPTTEKKVPNYLKPTISSSLVEPHSFNIPKNDASNKPIINRRRSYDKPPSPSRLPKKTHPSPPYSRQHNALVSPGPRGRSLPLPSKSTNSSKPIPERLSKTPKEGKLHQPALFAKSDKKSRSPSPSTSINFKKVPKDASSDSTIGSESNIIETTTEVTSVETGPEVKENMNEKVEVEQVQKVEKQEEKEVENKPASEVPPHVEHEHEHGNKHNHEVELYDEVHVQSDHDENVIPTVSEEEAAKEEADEDKHDEHENRNQEQCNNVNEIIPEIKHSTTEEEVEVKEKKEEEEEEYGQIIEEHHKSENSNVEEAVVEEEKEGFEGGISEEVNENKEGEDDEENVEREVKEELKTEEDSTQHKQQVQHGKKETQVSNDVIEETASMLMEARKNKVRALAGAFQTVIDDQTK
ncbi:unnamed protein product [Lupinus luteus]|uniref:Calmodulin-binding domain-containing protein n=1 Tax=Lupinus luteus TaxID=3873 RepID=A0AAV1W8I6_LUPLU